MKNYVSIEIDKLALASWNYKTENEELVEKLKNNIKLNGQIENIIVRELDTGFFEVVNGNHRLIAMKDLKIDKVVCYNLGKVSDAKAKRIAVETNETKFPADNIKLAETIKEILLDFTIDDIAFTMPYTKDDIENFNKMLEFSWDEVGAGSPQEEGEDFETIKLTLPREVAEQFKTQITRFKKILNPNEKNLDDLSPIQAIEAMCQILSQTPDKNILGE